MIWARSCIRGVALRSRDRKRRLPAAAHPDQPHLQGRVLMVQDAVMLPRLLLPLIFPELLAFFCQQSWGVGESIEFSAWPFP